MEEWIYRKLHALEEWEWLRWVYTVNGLGRVKKGWMGGGVGRQIDRQKQNDDHLAVHDGKGRQSTRINPRIDCYRSPNRPDVAGIMGCLAELWPRRRPGVADRSPPPQKEEAVVGVGGERGSHLYHPLTKISIYSAVPPTRPPARPTASAIVRRWTVSMTVSS